jgi:hypothetical protein
VSTRTRPPDGSFVPPDDGPLVELAGPVLGTLRSLATALRPAGPGGARITRREARRLLREVEGLAHVLRDVLGEDA